MTFGNINIKLTEKGWKALFIVLITLAGGFIYLVDYLPAKVLQDKQTKLLAAVLQGDGQLDLPSRTQTANCQPDGPLPDAECTPGEVFGSVGAETACQSGYSASVRYVPVSLKKTVFAQYGIQYPVPFGSYEVDHLIPLSLGGSNSIANLWPKSAKPFPGFYEKNLTGNYLREEVCAGNLALSVAQEKIAKDWFLIYRNIDAERMRELKAKYDNWADRK